MFKPSPPHPILTAREMRACDDYTINVLGTPSRTLMERAAGAVVDYLFRRDDLFPEGHVLVLSGGGNNGGDGLAAARFLRDGSRGKVRPVSVLYVGRWNAEGTIPDETAMSVECARQYRLLVDAGVPILHPDGIKAALRESVCVIDAMLGIGLSGPVRGVVPEVMEAVVRSSLPVLALDIPSGIHADKGQVMGHALPARATVTMQALKVGLLLYPGADFCGDLAVADIGIDLCSAGQPHALLADGHLLATVLPPRTRRSHKGTYGRVLSICGSVGMSGAAVLCARGALRSGAGVAEVLTPAENRTVLQISVPEAIVTAYNTEALSLGSAEPACASRRTALRAQIRGALGRASVVVIGCGLGQSEIARFVLRTVLELFPTDRRVPLVLDADALNLLSEDETLWETPALSTANRAVVLTPHPAEMARLYSTASAPSDRRTVSKLLEDTLGSASTFAASRGVTVVLKDAHTAVVSPAGERFLCPFGNAGMATGGSGDVLAGVIASLLGQAASGTASTASVAAAGVALHALAGDAAAERMGEIGLLPSDLIDRLPHVLRAYAHTRTRLENI